RVLPLVNSSACSVVAADDRVVTTCSRFGRPNAVNNGSDDTSDARTFPYWAAVAIDCAHFFSKFHGAMPASPNSAAGFQSAAAKSAFSQPSGAFAPDAIHEESLAKSILLSRLDPVPCSTARTRA